MLRFFIDKINILFLKKVTKIVDNEIQNKYYLIPLDNLEMTMSRESEAKEIMSIMAQKRPKRVINFFEEGFKGALVLLKILDKSTSPLTAGELASKLNVSTARIAVAITKLSSLGLIQKTKSINDARQTLVELTPLGKTKLRQKENDLLQLLADFLEKLNDTEVSSLLSIIKKI